MTDFKIQFKPCKNKDGPDGVKLYLPRKDLAILKSVGLSRNHIIGFIIQGYSHHMIERHVNEGKALPNPATPWGNPWDKPW
jgi:hypothetical protein